MKILYATITDAAYLVRAWALYRSLLPHLGRGHFLFYCVDDQSVRLLQALAPAQAHIIEHREFQSPELEDLFARRARNEYCWTCKPFILQHALARWPEADWAVYLDSDMAAFADPAQAFAQAGTADVLLTPHRFASPFHAAFGPTVGNFNAGLTAFRPTLNGLAALEWWARCCAALCPNIPVSGAYADQKYLDRLATEFSGVHASAHAGLNAAPWNIEAFQITSRADVPHLDGQPLLIYHFQALRILSRRLFDCYPGDMQVPAAAKRWIYQPYIRRLRDAFAEITAVSPGFAAGLQTPPPRWVLTQVRRLLRGYNNLSFI